MPNVWHTFFDMSNMRFRMYFLVWDSLFIKSFFLPSQSRTDFCRLWVWVSQQELKSICSPACLPGSEPDISLKKTSVGKKLTAGTREVFPVETLDTLDFFVSYSICSGTEDCLLG